MMVQLELKYFGFIYCFMISLGQLQCGEAPKKHTTWTVAWEGAVLLLGAILNRVDKSCQLYAFRKLGGNYRNWKKPTQTRRMT